ncbi:MAG: type III-A CRISPR-associated RAMP protein Csm5 [Candidatus Woesearchaeota archaeon]
METIKFKLKIATPLIISSGEQLTPLDYYIKSDRISKVNYCIIIDFEKFIEKVMNIYKNQYVVFAEEFLSAIGRNIKNNRFEKNIYELVSEIAQKNTNNNLLLGEKIFDDVTLFKFPTKENDVKTQLDFTLLTNDGKPYIPGSSIKGALKTAIFYKILQEKYLEILQRNNEGQRDIIMDLNQKINFMVRETYLKNAEFEIFQIRRSRRDNKFDSSKKQDKMKLSSALFVIGGEGDLEIQYENKINNFLGKKDFRSYLLEAIDEFYIGECATKIYETFKLEVPKITDNRTHYIQIGKYGNIYTKSLQLLFKKDQKYNKIFETDKKKIKVVQPKTISYIEYNNQKVQPGWVELTEV